MEGFLHMVEIQAVLFIYLMVGIACRKTGVISESSLPNFVDFLLKFAMPCMIFNSFEQELTLEMLKTAGLVVAVSLRAAVASYLLGKVLYLRVPHQRRCILQYGTLISNAGFAGLPLVAAAYGPEAVFYGSIFLIPMRIFMWTAGISLFTDATLRTKVKNVVTNPAIIAVVVGLVRMFVGFQLPGVLATAVHSMGDIASPLSIIAVGAILAEVRPREILDKDAFLLALVRLLVLPGILLVVLRLMHADFLLTATSVMLIGMPVGATTALLAKRYGADYRFGSTCIFVTTLLSLITAPLLSIFL